VLHDVLPTLGQIERIALKAIEAERQDSAGTEEPGPRDVWAKAHELAGLSPPKPQPPPTQHLKGNQLARRGERIGRMLQLCIEANADLPFPSYPELKSFTERAGLRLEAVPKGTPYANFISQIREERSAQGLDSPPDPRRKGRLSEPVTYQLPEHPIEPVDSVPERKWDREACIAVLQDYERGLPAGVRGSRHHYVTTRNPEWPAAKTIDRQGTNEKGRWGELWPEAQRRNQAAPIKKTQVLTG
jgi:hypothetical protein